MDFHPGPRSDFDEPLGWTVRGAGRRIVASILAPVAWVSVTLLYLAFWAGGLTLLQEVAVIAVSILTLFGFLVALWVSFGFRLARRWTDG